MPTAEHKSAAKPRALTTEEYALVENWVQLADSLGLPKSLAQIYGFIFASRRPVTAQDCVDALKISRSSAGQGLKTLKELGAIQHAFELGARREAFCIEPDLGVLLRGIMDGKLLPAFDGFFSRLEALEKNLGPKEHKFCLGRIQKLQRWRTKLNRTRKWLSL